MTPERWQRIKPVFYEALDRPVAEREAFVAEACANDATLCAEVVELLRSHATPGTFMDEPAATLADLPDAALREGQAIGGYTVIDVIGRGGMGIVYRAEQHHPKREVALKLVRRGIADRRLLRRFEVEATILGRLHHAGIAQIFEAGVHDDGEGGRPFFAMELVDGPNLTEYAERLDLSVHDRLELFARVCDATHYAHQHGVIHRDLKPANILVDGTGQPKILDFGVARVTDGDRRVTTIATGAAQLIGTLPYMSPEQVAGDPHAVDTRCDVYSLGVVGYELLSGCLPHDLSNRSVAEAARIIEDVEPTSLGTISRVFRGDVQTIIDKTLDKDPERRYQSASSLAADVRRFLHHEPIVARPPSALYQLRKFGRRNKALVGGIVATFVVLVLGLVGTSIGLVRARVEAQKLTAINDIHARIMRSGQAGSMELARDIEGRIAELADDPVDEAMMRHGIGMTYLNARRPDVAGPELMRALEIRRRVLGERHIDTIRTQHGMARLNLYWERFDEAETMLGEILEVSRVTLGGDHELTISTIVLLAELYERTGDLEAGVSFGREQVSLGRRDFGVTHPYTVTAMLELADTLQAAGRPDDAETLLREAVAVCEAADGREHTRTQVAMIRLARLRETRGDIVEGARLRRELVEIRRRTMPGDQRSKYSAINSLAVALVRTGELEEAESLFREGIAGLDRCGRTHTLLTIGRLFDLAEVQQELDRPADAEATYREILSRLPHLETGNGARARRLQEGLAASLRARQNAEGPRQ